MTTAELDGLVCEDDGEAGALISDFSESKGYGPCTKSWARILDAFRTQIPEAGLTYNVGMVLGGSSTTVDEAGNNGTATGKDNVISPTAYASGDIRTTSNEQTERVEKKMEAIVAEHLAKTGATISLGKCRGDGCDGGELPGGAEDWTRACEPGVCGDAGAE